MKNKNLEYNIFILDVDGVMTDGKFYYTKSGKVMKKFGPDDNDALSMLSKLIDIRFISGDKKGFAISKKRIETDMNYKIDLVSTTKRIDWIKKRYDPIKVMYMGDGIFDSYVMDEVGYSLCPNNSDISCIKKADYVTKRNGGDRAVSEACLHILSKFYNKNISELL